jgi:hypothetical protein
MRKQPVSFRAEVAPRFQFLIDQHGFDGPEYSELLLPAVKYQRPGMLVWIFLNDDTRDGAGTSISVLISLTTADGSTKADLEDLVEAAVFAPRHRVARKAHTGAAMRDTLDDNATWVRRLMPLLHAPDVVDLFQSANRYETDRAGNPKRRRPNIRWKYS